MIVPVLSAEITWLEKLGKEDVIALARGLDAEPLRPEELALLRALPRRWKGSPPSAVTGARDLELSSAEIRVIAVVTRLAVVLEASVRRSLGTAERTWQTLAVEDLSAMLERLFANRPLPRWRLSALAVQST